MTCRESCLLLALAVLALVASGIEPLHRGTWFLEAAPVLIALPLLVATHRRFPLTPLLQRLIFLHALVLLLGAHYTYAKVPAGDWVRDTFDLSRNHYDRVGHFMQGFMPAILAREILLRRSPLVRGKWLAFIVVSICLAFSASYELIEWAAAVLLGDGSDAFLATQGDVWDTQWDMFLALTGAVLALLLLARRHDRELLQLLGSGADARVPDLSTRAERQAR